MNKKVSLLLLVLILAVSVEGCSSGGDDSSKITLLHGHFSEIEILMQMAGILIEENTNLDIEWHDSMTTVTAAQANQDGEVDLYVTYDGTLLTTLMGMDITDVPEGENMYEWVSQKGIEERGLTLTEPFGFENTYAIAVRREFAEENNIKTISDLMPYTNELVFGAEHEFFDEETSMRFKPFNETYGANWGDSRSIDIGLKYAAIDSGNIDVTMGYSTDGLLKKSDLITLEDDKNFFPQYLTGFEVRDTLFDEFADTAPNLEEVLNMLAGQIDNEQMAELNYLVDVEEQDAYEVAKTFLVEVGLSE